MRKAFVIFLAIIFALSLVVGCAKIQSAYEKDKAALEAWWNTNQPKVAAFIATAKKALDALQEDYDFFARLLTAGAKMAGYDLNADDLAKIKNYVAAADASLAVIGPAVNSQPVDSGAVQNAVTAVNTAIPALKANALKSQNIAALYNAYIAAKAAQPAPAPAPAK